MNFFIFYMKIIFIFIFFLFFSQKFVRTVFEPIVESVGWETSENEKHTEKLLRGLVLNMAARNRDLNVIDKALEIFSNFTSNYIFIFIFILNYYLIIKY